MKKEFFAGASTPKGFFTYLPSVLPDMQTGFRYDIKGSSGSGKSTMMRRIAAVMRENGVETEYLHCASDPSSLDGLIFPKQQLAVTDSTAPHAMDPTLPGVSGMVVDLYGCLHPEKLSRFRPILTEALQKKQALYKSAFSYLSAAACILPNETADPKETEAIAAEIEKKYFPKTSDNKSIVRKMFLFAITPDGIVSYPDGLPDKKILIKGQGASQIIESLAMRAKANGISFDLCYSPLSPEEKPMQIILHDYPLAVLADCALFPTEGEEIYLSDPLPKYTKDVHQMIDKSITAMKKAREWHKKIESIYATAMDFSGVEVIGAQLTEDLLKRYKSA